MTAEQPAPEPLWTPSPERARATQLARFLDQLRESGRLSSDAGYDALWTWSVDQPADFWKAVWDETGIVSSDPPQAILEHGDQMPGATWFRGARLNFAENLLRHHDSDEVAVIGVWEGDRDDVRLTFRELYRAVARFQHTLEALGVGPGDRVAGFMPNVPESVIAMLATAGLGAIWSSCSPDFGFKGVMDRFGQIEPKVLITADGYQYNGKRHDSLGRVGQVVDAIDSIESVIVVPLIREGALRAGWMRWADAVDNDATAPHFEQVPFDHPLYIMYSSGTTGVPKCIVHGHGGTLVQHAKEHVFHCDLQRSDVLFYFTTCGWMMWNWLVSGLFVGASIVLYEGSPGYPGLDTLWSMAERLRITHFGTSPKFLTACAKAGVEPSSHDLGDLRSVMSTGAPLSVENFRWVYAHVSEDVQLASICGGTDLISCFMLGSPIDPVYPGEIQKRGLGMRVAAWRDENHPVVGEKAELVCTAPFPSMPIGFWQDPDNEKYLNAYFRTFPGVWRHGDFIELTPRGGVIVYGRSDATLNPGGVRIGTAEIYRQVERLPEVVDSLVVGLPTDDDDTEVVLFVVLREGVILDDGLKKRIRTQIRSNTTPRHVPRQIHAAPEVPRTISGKKVEIAVTRVLTGETVKNRDALKNPEALDWFSERA